MSAALREFSIYTSGAFAAFCVDVAILALLVELAGIHYLIAATVAFMCGTVVAYWVSVRHAFRYRRVNTPGSEFSVFAAIGLVGIAINAGVMHIAVENFALHYMVGKLMSTGLTFIWNFAVRKALLFTARPTTASNTSNNTSS